jgi:hypothetical protein
MPAELTAPAPVGNRTPNSGIPAAGPATFRVIVLVGRP